MADEEVYDFFQNLFGKEVGSKIAERNLEANREFDAEYQVLSRQFQTDLVDAGDTIVVDSNEYRVGQRLGRGGYASVFYVENIKTQEGRAIKTTLPSKDVFLDYERAQEAIRQEARMLSEIACPEVVKQYGTFEHKKILYVMLEYLPKEVLDLLEYHQENSFGAFFNVAKNLALALQTMDQQDVISFDIKPGNTRVDSSYNPKLIDFGSAHQTGKYRQIKPAVTDLYVAPELLRRRKEIKETLSSSTSISSFAIENLSSICMSAHGVGREVDVYSYGITLAEIAALASVKELVDQSFLTLRSDFRRLLADRSFEVPSSERIDEKKFLALLKNEWFVDDRIVNFISGTIDPDPNSRIKASDLVHRVRELESLFV